jgi:flagellar export protein FliJ
MKSQFSKIAKIRKQKREVIERDLLKSKNKEKMLSHKIASFYEQIHALALPKEGTISMLSLIAEQKKILGRDKKSCEQELLSVQNETRTLQEAYQKAHIEYEKIHYLEEQELQAMIAKLKRQEQLDLDEVSTQLFANQMSKRVHS